MRSSYVLSFLVAAIAAIFLFGQFYGAKENVNTLNKVLTQAQSVINK